MNEINSLPVQGEIMTEEIKLRCHTCEQDLPLSAFGPNRSETYRYRHFKQSSCRECVNENARLKRRMTKAVVQPPQREVIDRTPYPEVRQYLIHFATEKTESRGTVQFVMGCLSALLNPIKDRFGIERIEDITPEHILSCYETRRIEQNWASSTCEKIVGVCKRFFAWLALEGKGMPGFIFPQVSYPKPIQQTPMVIQPETLFAMRQLSKVRMECAVALEIGLSSGLRPGEIFNSLSPNQIFFDRHPVELSTGKPSPYSGGMVKIDSSNRVIKSGQSRITFISKAAARILKRYMQEVGLRPDSKVPLFPYANNVYASWLDPFRAAFPELLGETVTHQLGKKLEVEDLMQGEQLSEHFRERLKSGVKKRNQFKGPVDAQAGKQLIEETQGLHWHTFRHTAACCLYYRNWYGERHDVERVRLLLGHREKSTTFIYLSQLALIRDDSEWAQVFLGRASDWSRVKRLGKEGSYD